MDYNPLYIERLKQDIERLFGRTCKSPADFKMLTYQINDVKKEAISESTLRRIWGYSKTKSKARLSTLTALARCLDYIDWDAYVLHLVREKLVESDYINTHSVAASDMSAGDRVRVTWLPDREVEMRYEGNETFVVEKSLRSKLCVGDRFRCSMLRVGAPMICMDIRRGNLSPGSYIAGSANGLKEIVYMTGD